MPSIDLNAMPVTKIGGSRDNSAAGPNSLGLCAGSDFLGFGAGTRLAAAILSTSAEGNLPATAFLTLCTALRAANFPRSPISEMPSLAGIREVDRLGSRFAGRLRVHGALRHHPAPPLYATALSAATLASWAYRDKFAHRKIAGGVPLSQSGVRRGAHTPTSSRAGVFVTDCPDIGRQSGKVALREWNAAQRRHRT